MKLTHLQNYQLSIIHPFTPNTRFSIILMALSMATKHDKFCLRCHGTELRGTINMRGNSRVHSVSLVISIHGHCTFNFGISTDFLAGFLLSRFFLCIWISWDTAAPFRPIIWKVFQGIQEGFAAESTEGIQPFLVDDHPHIGSRNAHGRTK